MSAWESILRLKTEAAKKRLTTHGVMRRLQPALALCLRFESQAKVATMRAQNSGRINRLKFFPTERLMLQRQVEYANG